MVTDVENLPRVATIATMPSRLETFEQVLAAIAPQVARVFVYLDGHAERPAFLDAYDNVTTYFAPQVGDLHASSRFLCLGELDAPAVVVSVDDDIAYPPDYVAVLAQALAEVGGRAVVGVHGRIFLPPHRSYVHDASLLHFTARVRRPRHVHEIGVGTCAFVSTVCDVDPRRWPRHDMDDLMLAIEAQLRGLPRVVVAREDGWLEAYAQDQPDSLWVRAQRDETEHSRLMRALLARYAKVDAVASSATQSRAAGPTGLMPA